MSTDREWERWGQLDPYFGVITHERFRRSNLDDEARRAFFDSGRVQVDYVLAMCRTFIDSTFQPVDVMDFGCGVGRVTIPFAAHCTTAVGIDVSVSMLEEARRNVLDQGAQNVAFHACNDDLTPWHGAFDLVHSCIVLQHIEPERVRSLFGELVRCVRPGGICALQLTYAKAWLVKSYGQPPRVETADPAPRLGIKSLLGLRNSSAQTMKPAEAEGDPGMQMFSHELNPLLFMMQQAGVGRFHADFTDHGGELGVSLFFRVPGSG